MKVFISWSGEKSHKVAVCFRDWLPSVIQTVVPYVSSEDIDKGARWSVDISSELDQSFFGILCITKSNLDAPWINFEAGALSKQIERSNVAPFLFDLARSDVTGPIVQFQSTLFEKEDVRKLVLTINKACGDRKLDENRLDSIFEVFWEHLEKPLREILSHDQDKVHAKVPSRTDAMLEEMLELTRVQSRLIVERDRQIYEAVREMFVEARDGLIEPDHPMMMALEKSWDDLVNLLSTIAVSDNVSVDLNKKTSEVLKSLDYIFNRTSRLRVSRGTFISHGRGLSRLNTGAPTSHKS